MVLERAVGTRGKGISATWHLNRLQPKRFDKSEALGAFFLLLINYFRIKEAISESELAISQMKQTIMKKKSTQLCSMLFIKISYVVNIDP